MEDVSELITQSQKDPTLLPQGRMLEPQLTFFHLKMMQDITSEVTGLKLTDTPGVDIRVEAQGHPLILQ